MLASAVMVAATAVGLSLRQPKKDLIHAGAEVSSVLPEAVRHVTFKTGAVVFVAQRKDDGPFNVRVTFSDGRPSQTCSVSSDLGGHLAALTVLTAKSGETDAASFPIQLGVLEVKSHMQDDDSPPVEFRRRADMRGVALYNKHAFEVDPPYPALAAMEAGCAGVGARR